jgi:hypothetical protein
MFQELGQTRAILDVQVELLHLPVDHDHLGFENTGLSSDALSKGVEDYAHIDRTQFKSVLLANQPHQCFR